jgi:arabinogalactan oligomer/maltooligosaccharide transport system substrate-binding protein
MKKIVVAASGVGALLLLALVIAGISALIVKGAYSRAAKDIAAEQTAEGRVSGPLLVWMDNNDWAKAVIEGFNKKYPDVVIKYENVGNVDARGKVSLDGPAGIGPDVFLMPHDHIGNAIIDDICLPFPPELQQKYSQLLLDAAVKTCTSEGETVRGSHLHRKHRLLL